MSGTYKMIKGRIREAFGTLTGSKRLQTKGKAQQAVGKVEKKADKGVSKARQTAKETIEEAKEVADNTVEQAKADKMPKKD